MPDIRNFFGGKGSQPISSQEKPVKKKAGKRKIIEDSDDEELPYVYSGFPPTMLTHFSEPVGPRSKELKPNASMWRCDLLMKNPKLIQDLENRYR